MFSHVSLCFSATLVTAAGNATRTCHDNQMWDDTDVGRLKKMKITYPIPTSVVATHNSNYNERFKTNRYFPDVHFDLICTGIGRCI